jgi:hypothetical protein
MADKLNPGDLFPRLSLNIAGGESFSPPDDIDTPLAVVLFYRGHW